MLNLIAPASSACDRILPRVWLLGDSSQFGVARRTAPGPALSGAVPLARPVPTLLI
jgi:hypothetical protein